MPIQANSGNIFFSGAKVLHFPETCKYILPKNVEFLLFIPLRQGLSRYREHF